MPWNGSGVFNRTNGIFTGSTVWNSTFLDDRDVRSDDHDTHDEDIATGMENTVTRDGQNQPSANLPMGGFRHTGVDDASARDDYAAAGQVQDQSFNFVPGADVSGSANNITLSPTPAITAYAAGQLFAFLQEGNNSGAVTVDVSSLGTRAVQKNGTALVSGDLLTGNMVVIQYDGTQFQMISPPAILLDAALTTGSNTFIGDQTIQESNDGSGEGPVVNLTRISSTPAANDSLARLNWRGRDSGGSSLNYASILGRIVDPTNTSEDGALWFRTFVGGSDDTRIVVAEGLYSDNATGGDQGVDTANFSQVFDDGNQIHALQDGLESEQATTSGTAFNFTGIRSDARRITVILEEITVSGTDDLLIQIGDSGGLENTGYLSTSANIDATPSLATSTSGFIIEADSVNPVSGHLVLINISDGDGLTWISSHTAKGGTVRVHSGGGSKTLSARLDRVTLTRTGTDTFTAGSVNILVE